MGGRRWQPTPLRRCSREVLDAQLAVSAVQRLGQPPRAVPPALADATAALVWAADRFAWAARRWQLAARPLLDDDAEAA